MALDPVRLVEHLHGHAGWLAAATLVHPAIVLRRPQRRAHLAIGLSTALVTLVSAAGVWLYAGYRQRLKQGIFLSAPSIGWLFERKEHLAFAAVLFAWTGAAAYFAAPRASEPTRALLRTVAHRAFVLSAAIAILVGVLGTIVAVHRSF